MSAKRNWPDIVTEARASDGQMLPMLIEQARHHADGQMKQVVSAGGDDSKATFNYY